jgi:hypothetical protein
LTDVRWDSGSSDGGVRGDRSVSGQGQAEFITSFGADAGPRVPSPPPPPESGPDPRHRPHAHDSYASGCWNQLDVDGSVWRRGSGKAVSATVTPPQHLPPPGVKSPAIPGAAEPKKLTMAEKLKLRLQAQLSKTSQCFRSLSPCLVRLFAAGDSLTCCQSGPTKKLHDCAPSAVPMNFAHENRNCERFVAVPDHDRAHHGGGHGHGHGRAIGAAAQIRRGIRAGAQVQRGVIAAAAVAVGSGAVGAGAVSVRAGHLCVGGHAAAVVVDGKVVITRFFFRSGKYDNRYPVSP